MNAELLAVGRGAKAVKIINRAERVELLNAIHDLEGALNKVTLPASSRQVVQQHVSELSKAARETPPDAERVGGILQHITNGLKSAGVAVKEVADLIGPIQKIAGVVHLGLSVLGLV